MYNKITGNIVVVFYTLIIFSVSLSSGYAQSGDTTYSVTTYISLGYSRFISDLSFDRLNKNGFSGTVRIMWEPEHLLSVGIESGYVQLYKLDNQQVGEPPRTFGITSNLNTIPIIAVFSMRIFENIKLSVGSGMFILYSNVDAMNTPVTNSQLSTGSYFAANYFRTLSGFVSLGGEIKYFYINKIEDGNLTFQLSLQYKFLIY
jgi:hypothetical protein